LAAGRGEPVPPGDDDQSIRVRVYDQSVFVEDAGEGGEGKHHSMPKQGEINFTPEFNGI
jgi:hypothetical protein